jgi:hypothetical protein
MSVIREYPLDIGSGYTAIQVVPMPAGAHFLSAHESSGVPVLCMSVPLLTADIPRLVAILLVGDTRPPKVKFAGTVYIAPTAYHIFLGRYANDPRP